MWNINKQKVQISWNWLKITLEWVGWLINLHDYYVKVRGGVSGYYKEGRARVSDMLTYIHWMKMKTDF